ncbi:hypothetical protein ATI61_101215 [Archangium gephyra]|uniref:Uncharacterized protein n=1 Tax=Archangium gephyra TaxID=48 RepID=A0AAC8QC16_9BACT|nr:hypothetical protein [Archangium gephyra]AKJ04706.1 Hypothetical protein AA314_06332 [Archangium gephyra]REG37235.1 hypothetical protein ATI61_101215 [Archangium gephyra]
MQRKQIMGSLVLALGLVSGPALALDLERVSTEKELDPIINEEAEVFPATLELAFQDPSPETQEETKEDFIPELPILLQGKLYSSGELQEAGVHLSHYVLDARSAEMNVVQGFRTAEEMKVYLEKTGQMPSEQPSERQYTCTASSNFYENASYQGLRFSVMPGDALGNLGNWDNRISSLQSSSCASWTVLFDHPNFGGRQLWIGGGWSVPRLGSFWFLGINLWWWWRWFAWDNRASSVAVYL